MTNPQSKKRARRSVTERIEDHVIPEPNSGCHIWMGATSRGYPYINDGTGRIIRVGRFVCEQTHGPMAPGIEARHLCHTPLCVRSDHLIPGTRQDNVEDRIRAGRQTRGSQQAGARLDERKVAIGRALGMRPVAFAERFGVSRAVALQALSGRKWRHVRVIWERPGRDLARRGHFYP